MLEYDEEAILKPRDPDIEDQEDWPQYTLTNVEIHDESSGEMRSLLDADEFCPLTVTGKLAQLPAHLRVYQIDQTTLPALVTISGVESFAYGQLADGEAIFWAVGKAGWYTISPARGYRQCYKAMKEALLVLYFVIDLHKGSQSKRSHQIPLHEIFKKYVQHSGSNCGSKEHAATRFRIHRDFLLSAMLKEQDTFNWIATPIYTFLKQAPTPPKDSLDNTDTDDTSGEIVSKANARGRSILRPKAGKLPGKSAGKRFKHSVVEVDRSEGSSHAQSTSFKRKQKPVTQRMEARKRANTIEDSDRHAMIVSGANAASEAAEEAELPLRTATANRETRNTEPIVRIVEDVLPQYEPTGPGNAWTCNFDGCSHVIYGALSVESKVLIKEHYQSHASESQAKLDLLRQEETPYLPVSNLLKRVREVAGQHFDFQQRGP